MSISEEFPCTYIYVQTYYVETYYEYGHKAGGDDDPVPLAIAGCFAHQDAVEDEVTQTQLGTRL